jgi:hypothetical protein
MFRPLSSLPDHSRIWLYQSSRLLQADEVIQADSALRHFAESWQAHGAPVAAWAGVVHNLFLLFAADEQSGAAVSGCSIDGSVRVVRELGAHFGLDFFGRLVLAVEGGQGLELLHRDQLAEGLASGIIQPESPAFDLTVSDLGSWHRSFQRPLNQTWAAGSLALSGSAR